jgi:hypothetical protein
VEVGGEGVVDEVGGEEACLGGDVGYRLGEERGEFGYMKIG